MADSDWAVYVARAVLVTRLESAVTLTHPDNAKLRSIGYPGDYLCQYVHKPHRTFIWSRETVEEHCEPVPGAAFVVRRKLPRVRARKIDSGLWEAYSLDTAPEKSVELLLREHVFAQMYERE